MRRKSIAWCLPGALVVLALLAAVPAAARPERFAGEKVDYRVTWNRIPTGTFSLEFDVAANPRESEALVVRGRTRVGGLASIVSSFEADAASFFHPGTLVPFRSTYHSVERHRTTTEVTGYCHEERLGRWERERVFREGERETREDEFSIPAFFQDPLSLMHYLRTIDLEVGKTITVPVVADRKEFNARLTVRERRPIRIMGRVRQAFIIVPDVPIAGSSMRGGSLWIWISDDAERLPLNFSSRVPLGVLTMTMVDYRPPGGRP